MRLAARAGPGVALVLSLAVAAGLTPARAAANPTQELARARGEYERGEYQRAVDILHPQLYPRAQITDPEELVLAHELLGIVYFYLEKRDLAYAEFLAVLKLEPTHELDPVENSPDVYAFFETIKRENAEKLEEIRKQRERDRAQRQRPSVRLTRTIVHHPQVTWTNWLPFGVGQYRNGQRGWGHAFLATEATLAGVSVGAFFYQLYRFGLDFRQDFSPQEIDQIFSLQVTQVVTGALFFAVYGLGVWHAYEQQPPAVTVTEKEEPLSSRPRLRMSVTPVVTSGGAFLGAAWEF